jgi:NitT/TauT family transport system ATP-binding protein
LGLAHVDKGDIALTAVGRRYVEAEQALKQELFGQQLLEHIPLVADIRRGLENEPSGTVPGKRFLELLADFLKEDEAERVLQVAIEWGRYGEVYEYDFRTGMFTLPERVEQ